MKRGKPLERRTPLGRGKGLARASVERRGDGPGAVDSRSKPGRGSQLKRSRRTLSKAEREAAAEFKASVQGRPCVVCGRVWPEMDAHHGIEAQTLRNLAPDHVYDKRNAVPICPRWEPCHGDHTSRMRPIPRDALPMSVEEFAGELMLEHLLLQIYGPTE